MQVEILVGPIACGKSTYAKARAEQGAIIVNDDAIVMACHGGNYSKYEKSNKSLYKRIEDTMVCEALNNELDVIIDRPNFKRSTRQFYTSLARRYGATSVVAVMFPNHGPAFHAERRAMSDSRGLALTHWKEVAEHQHKFFDGVYLSEGFDSLIPADVAWDFIDSDREQHGVSQ